MGRAIGKAGEVTQDVPCVLELKVIADRLTAFPIHDGEGWTLAEIDTVTAQWAGPLASCCIEVADAM
jgi:hypothetical protein